MTLEDQISIEIINFDKLRLSFDREWKTDLEKVSKTLYILDRYGLNLK